LSGIDLQKLAKEWEAGDEEEELMTSTEESERRNRRRREESNKKLIGMMDGGEKSQKVQDVVTEMSNIGKTSMMIIDLNMENAPKADDGKRAYVREDISKMCALWRKHLGYKMIEITCFPNPPESAVVTAPGRDADDVFRYLSRVDSIKQVSWDDKIAKPSEITDDDDEL